MEKVIRGISVGVWMRWLGHLSRGVDEVVRGISVGVWMRWHHNVLL